MPAYSAYTDPNHKRNMIKYGYTDNLGFLEKWKYIGVGLIVGGIFSFIVLPMLFGAFAASANSGMMYLSCLSPLMTILSIGVIIFGVYVLAGKLKKCSYYEHRITRALSIQEITDAKDFFYKINFKKEDIENVQYFSRSSGAVHKGTSFEHHDAKFVIKFDTSYFNSNVIVSAYTYVGGKILDPTDVNNFVTHPGLKEDYFILHQFHEAFKFDFKPKTHLSPVYKEELNRRIKAAATPRRPKTALAGKKRPASRRSSKPKPKPAAKPKAPVSEAHAQKIPCMHCGNLVDFTNPLCPYCGKGFF